jgi:nucleoside-diphosphate-sugar epimerase
VNELYARLYTHTFNLPVIALRYFNVYGPRQRPDSDYAAAISIFIRQLVTGEPITIMDQSIEMVTMEGGEGEGSPYPRKR